MGLVAASLVAAVAVGALLGGTFGRLAAVPLRGWPLLVAAALAQLAGAGWPARLGPGWCYPASLAASAALALGFLARNRRLPGVPLVALGLLLNAVVVVANGAMPVSAYAAAHAGVPLDAVAAGLDSRHVVADAATRLGPLGDVVPVALPVRPEVASVGDLLVAVGLAWLVSVGMRRPRAIAAAATGRMGRAPATGRPRGGTRWRSEPAGGVRVRRARRITASGRTPE